MLYQQVRDYVRALLSTPFLLWRKNKKSIFQIARRPLGCWIYFDPGTRSSSQEISRASYTMVLLKSASANESISIFDFEHFWYFIVQSILWAIQKTFDTMTLKIMEPHTKNSTRIYQVAVRSLRSYTNFGLFYVQCIFHMRPIVDFMS